MNRQTETSAPLSQRLGDVPMALAQLDEIERRLNQCIPVIFLDYDGTLTPVVERPELAVLNESGRKAVARVADRLPTCVVSGRDRADVEAMVGVETIIYAGSHGFDIHIPGQGNVELEGMHDFDVILNRAEEMLNSKLGALDGAIVERKKFSIACHYRLVAAVELPGFHRAVDETLMAVAGLKEKGGKKIRELQPDIDWDKGKAVLHLLGALSLDDEKHVPLFIGDDLTDEDAFRALRQRKGAALSIVVADADGDLERRTLAEYRLENPDEVLDLLTRLLDFQEK